ncbi:hypothetical protein AKJ09_06162 [Labilithrix luteola]|uniref:Uncharacterized protein n=1 Tax=Labilithrix luteola TaxID=1391654 RepID=A0A0K1Q136_9BACT|nr:hypothetical protein AKJ09_06162 [Labilithrix luteola]
MTGERAGVVIRFTHQRAQGTFRERRRCFIGDRPEPVRLRSTSG